jgi:hypothetical protein
VVAGAAGAGNLGAPAAGLRKPPVHEAPVGFLGNGVQDRGACRAVALLGLEEQLRYLSGIAGWISHSRKIALPIASMKSMARRHAVIDTTLKPLTRTVSWVRIPPSPLPFSWSTNQSVSETRTQRLLGYNVPISRSGASPSRRGVRRSLKSRQAEVLTS